MITKIALFHPWIKSKGGAERVVLEILKKSKDKRYKIDVYTWVYDENNTFEEFKKFKINVIAPKFARKFSRHYILRGLFFPIGLFSKIPVKNYNIFLISTSGLAELIALRNYKKRKTFAYVHTILRASYKEDVKWNLKNRYRNPIKKLVYITAVKIYKILEKMSWKKIDIAIFNSELSLERAKNHNLIKNKKIYVIHPPIKNLERRSIKTKKENYFFYVSRFNPIKRQDILIRAWDKFVKENLNYKLILAGGIEDKKYFEHLCKMAKKTKNVEIKINLNDKDIKKLYSNCLAVIFIPFMEDFGIVPFEALSMKKPLIVTNKGGYMKVIKDLPQVIQIEERGDREEMVDEIYKCLKQFLGLKIKFKKINFNHLNEENFRKKLFDVLEGKK